MFSIESVKSLAHSNPTAEAVFLAFSQRERGRHVINVDLLQAKLKAQSVNVDEKEFFTIFKKLEELKIGNLVYGRRGNPTYFTWYFDLKDVAKVGLGTNNVEPKPIAPTKPAKAKKRAKSKGETVKMGSKRGRKRKYVYISIPIEMLKGL